MPDLKPVPLADTRPITFDNLLEDQRGAVERVNTILRTILAEKSSSEPRLSPARRDVWATADYERAHRVIFIEGDRGVGKTSVMLTLIAGWRAAWTGNWDAVNPTGAPNPAGFDAVGSKVRVLPPLDFDPIPADLPLLCAVVTAFRPLSVSLTATCSPGDSPPRRSSKSEGSMDEDVLRAWQRLFRAASVGWMGNRLREARDLVDGVLDLEAQAVDWSAVRGHWHGFVDRALAELERAEPGVRLIVVPIDDVDMESRRVEEVLHVLRLLHHPAIVFVLTGHRKHAEYVTYLRELGELRRIAGTDRRSARSEDESTGSAEDDFAACADWAGRIARSRIEKIVPEPYQVTLIGLALEEEMRSRHPRGEWLRHRLSREKFAPSFRGRLFPYSTMEELVEVWPWLAELPAIPIRTFAHAGELSFTADLDRSGIQRLLLALLGELTSPEPTALQLRATDQANGVLQSDRPSALLFFGQGPRYKCRRLGSDGGWREARPAEKLRADLDAPRTARTNFLEGEHFLWSVWRRPDVGAIFRWVLPIIPRSPVELHNLQLIWRRFDPAQETTIQGVAYRWILTCLATLGPEGPDPHPNSPGEVDWRRLLDFVWRETRSAEDAQRRSGDHSPLAAALGRIAHRSIPLLAAPEYGMENWARALVLSYTRTEVERHGSIDVWSMSLSNDRFTGAVLALRTYRESSARLAPRDWIGGPDPDEAGHLEAGELLQRIDGDTDSLWRTYVSPAPWFTAANPSLSTLFAALLRPYNNGRRTSPFHVARTGPMQAALDAMFRATDVVMTTVELNHLALLADAGFAQLAVNIWRAAVDGIKNNVGPETVRSLTRLVGPESDESPPPRRPVVRISIGATSLGGFEMRPDGVVEENRSQVPMWTVDGLPVVGPPMADGIKAMLMLVQSVLADSGEPPVNIKLCNWKIQLPRASDATSRGPGPEIDAPPFEAWIDHDLLSRQIQLVNALAEALPGDIGRRARREWQLHSVLAAIYRLVSGDRTAPTAQYHPVSEEHRGLLAARAAEILKNRAYAGWWVANQPHFASVLPEAGGSRGGEG